MSRFVVLELPAGSTLAVNQIVPFFAYVTGNKCVSLLGDATVVRANGTKATLQMLKVEPTGMSVSSPPEDGVPVEDWFVGQRNITHVRFLASIGTQSAAGATLKLDKASLKLHAFTSDPGTTAVDQGKVIKAEKVTWTTEARWAHYWPLVEKAYPALKGLVERPVRPNGLCAEAALVLSLLVMSDELKAWRLASARGSRVEALHKLVHEKAPNAKPHFLNPGNSLSYKLQGESASAAYPAVSAAVQSALTTFASTAYKTFFKGPEPLPQIRMSATGDASGTRGILGKHCEAITLVNYVEDEGAAKAELKYKTYQTALKHSGQGVPTVLHVFLTAMNYAQTRIQITVTVDNSHVYHLLGIKSGASATLTPTDSTWADNASPTTPVEVTPPGQAKKTVQKWGDGTYYDPADRDLVIPGSHFASAVGGFSVHVRNTDTRGADWDDETLLGLMVVPGDSASILPPPVRMMGLFANDSQVPYKKGAPGTDTVRLTAAYKHVDKVAEQCVGASTFGVKMIAGGIGRLEAGLVVSAVQGTDKLADLKALGESTWKELRSSFLIPTKRGTKVELEIRSFTDPNYEPEDEAWTYNQALSDRRCWGILGLLASRMALKGAIGKSRAKAVWQAGVSTDPESEALKAYLKSPGALQPSTLG